MSLATAQPAPACPDSPPRRPTLRAVVGRTVASLAVAVIAPAVLFTVALVVFDVTEALLAALGWVVGAMGWRWCTGRPVSGLLLLTLGIMTVRTAFTLATGNTFVYFVQPVFADAAVAALFLGSLCTARPLVARIAPDFYPVDAALAARPSVHRLFRRLTVLWGVVVAAKGTVTLWLLLSQSMVDFVLIKNGAIIAMTVAAAATTVLLAAVAGRREGLFQPA